MLARCRSRITVILLSMIVGCAIASPMPDTAYNLGVRACQVKDYASARQHWSHLATAFEEGKGTRASMTDAYAWYRCAVANFPAVAQDEAESEIAQDARQSLLHFLASLPLEQLVASEQLARDYVARYSSNSAVQR